jgi:glycine oxidase
MKSFDVAIAGAGLIGSSIALELARAGSRVGLFDSGEPGREASWAGAGILSPAPESSAMLPVVELGKASLKMYPEFVVLVEEISGQKVGYRPKGTLETFSSRNAIQQLSTVVALHHGLGLRAEPLSARDARKLEPALSEDVEAAVLRPSRCAGFSSAKEEIAAQTSIVASGSFSGAIAGVAPFAPVKPAKGQMVALRSEKVVLQRVV